MLESLQSATEAFVHSKICQSCQLQNNFAIFHSKSLLNYWQWQWWYLGFSQYENIHILDRWRFKQKICFSKKINITDNFLDQYIFFLMKTKMIQNWNLKTALFLWTLDNKSFRWNFLWGEERLLNFSFYKSATHFFKKKLWIFFNCWNFLWVEETFSFVCQ